MGYSWFKLDSFALENPDLFNLNQKIFRSSLSSISTGGILIRDNIEGQYYHIETEEDVRGDYYQPQIEFDYAVRRFFPNPNYKQNLTVYIKNIKLKFKQDWSKYFENTFRIKVKDYNSSSSFITSINIPNTELSVIDIPDNITSNELSPGYSESVITQISFHIYFALKYKNGWYD